MIVDVSMYQHTLVLDDLPDHVSGVIIKASQGTYEDPSFAYFLAQARADARWKFVGFYHFLSDRGVQAEAAHFLNMVTAAGGLRRGEFVVLDWENNAITGYRPPMSDARAWMTIVNNALPGHVAWYSYRSNAIKARQSGDFPWPLWLADPNPDGLSYAQQLDAFLLQSGQQELAGINIDVNDIVDIATLEEITGDDDMALSDEDVQRIATAVWEHAITKGEETEPARQWILFPLDELQRPDLLQARLVAAIPTAATGGGAVGPLQVTLTGTATPG